MMPALLGMGSGAIGALGPAAGGAALAVGGSAATLGVAGLGAALGIMPIISRMESTNKALRESVMPVITALDQLKHTFTAVTSTVRPELMAAMESGLHDLGGALRHMEPLIEGSAKGFGVVSKIFGEFTNNPGFSQFMTWAGGEAPTAMGDAMRVLTNLFIGFGNILQSSTPLINGFMTQMREFTGGFSQWAQGLKHNKGWQQFLRDAKTDMGLVGNVLGSLGKDIGDLYTAIKPAGPPLIKVLGDLAKGLGPDIKTLGKDLAPVWPKLGKLLEAIATDLPKDLNKLLKALGPIIGEAAKLLGLVEGMTHVGGHHGKGGFDLFGLIGGGLAGGMLFGALKWAGKYPVFKQAEQFAGILPTDAEKALAAAGGDASKLPGILGRILGRGSEAFTEAPGVTVASLDQFLHAVAGGLYSSAGPGQDATAYAAESFLKRHQPKAFQSLMAAARKQFNFTPTAGGLIPAWAIVQGHGTGGFASTLGQAQRAADIVLNIHQPITINGTTTPRELAQLRAELKRATEEANRKLATEIQAHQRSGVRG